MLYQEKINLALNEFRRDPFSKEAYYKLILLYIEGGEFGKLRELLRLIDELYPHHDIISYSLIFDLFFHEGGAYDETKITTFLNYDNPQISNERDFLLQLVASCTRLNLGDIKRGGRELFELSHVIKKTPRVSKHFSYLTSMEWLTKQYVTIEEIKTFITEEPPQVLNKIEFFNRPIRENEKEKPVIFTACDGGYFKKFSSSFTETFASSGHIHFHIVNPEEEEIERFTKANQNLSFNISTEQYDLGGGPPFYAIVRFLRAKEIMEYYNTDVAMVDLDVNELNNFQELCQKCRDYNVSYFEQKTVFTWLRCWATFLYFTNNQKTKDYLDIAKKTYMHRLDGARWLTDQSIMKCLSFYMAQERPDIKMNILKGNDGMHLYDYLATYQDEDKKKEAKAQMPYFF